jgi:hypothetical protein
VVRVMPVLPLRAADPVLLRQAADLYLHPLEVIGMPTVRPLHAMVLALPWSERLLSRPLPLPLAR